MAKMQGLLLHALQRYNNKSIKTEKGNLHPDNLAKRGNVWLLGIERGSADLEGYI